MPAIEFEKFTLSNGLDVILHQDHSLPLVAVNVWYHVGSKNEVPGKTGFAHLFEHLMFEGTKHHNSSHFEPLQQVGANLNGSTTTDRTNYWETLPSNYLNLALWLEADRMGFLLDALDQRRFDVQRDVVKNERRQSYENRPYGMAGIQLPQAIYPPPHPYHWPTIGFHEDLDAADLDDVKDFFRRFYTPSNASLAIAGDIQAKEARELVEYYFGDLAPGTTPPRAQRADSQLQGQVKLEMHDSVMLPRVYLAWPTVPRFHEDDAALSVLDVILGDGKSSRLHRALVYEQRVAQSAGANHGAAEISGQFNIEVTAAAGHSSEEVESSARAELEKMRVAPPTKVEVARAKNLIEWEYTRQMAGIGGFGGRADLLNYFNVFAGEADLINSDLQRYLAVGPEDVQRVAEKYLGDRHVQLTVLPEPTRSQGTTAIDRTLQPTPATPRGYTIPAPQRQRLDNGLDILVMEKRALPIVAFGLMLNTGAVNDPLPLPGLAAFTTAMLQEGTSSRSSRQIAEGFEFLGSQLGANSGREGTSLSVRSLAREWPKALELVADLVRNPTFPDDELARVRTERTTNLRRMRDDATAVAALASTAILFGREGSYGHPILGTEDALLAISRDDLARHHESIYGPEMATLAVVGDVDAEEVRQLAESLFGGWTVRGQQSNVDTGNGSGPGGNATRLYIIDRPGAPQSVIRAAYAGVPRNHPDYFALVLLNHVFGGQFTARLNMNLRQDKGYSYGYNSRIEWHRHASSMVAGGSVQTEVTTEAVKETLKEFDEIRSGRPVELEEFETARSALLRQFPSSFETPWQMLDQLAQIVTFGLPDNYYQTLTANIEAVTLEQVRRVAEEHVDADQLTVLVVGDRSGIEEGLGTLGMPIQLVDHEGRQI